MAKTSTVFTIPATSASSSPIQHALKIKRLDERAILPMYQTAGAACFDLHALLPAAEYVLVNHQRPVTIRTGLSFEVPQGYVMMIYSRSGHGFNHDTRLSNCVGVIDSDFRGEVNVRLAADGRHDGLGVMHGHRIAQAMLVPVTQWQIVEVNELSTTARGEGGYGSTGA